MFVTCLGGFFFTAVSTTEAAYSDTVLGQSPTAYWRFEETSGTNADDATANNNDGTYTGGYTLATTSLINDGGNAVVLDGVDGRIDGSTIFSNQASITWSAWIKPNYYRQRMSAILSLVGVRLVRVQLCR